MTPDLIELAAPAATILAAGVGAYLSGRLGQRLYLVRESDNRRVEAAARCIEGLTLLRELLLNARTKRDPAEWAEVLNATFDSLDDARYLMPRSMRHLHRSVRSAVGTAVGAVSLTKLDADVRGWSLELFDKKWNDNALEYVDYVMDRIRLWREQPHKAAGTMSVSTFDEWLERSSV